MVRCKLPPPLHPGAPRRTRLCHLEIFTEEIMELVELTPLKGALVGLPGVDGLSTEQRKRLTITVELVANPSIIFMDEPTSGLDARAAAIVMRAFRSTVDTGRTVVCTIHQPSIEIFEAFDELFLMKRGGEEIYVGPIGQNSCHLIAYFEVYRSALRLVRTMLPLPYLKVGYLTAPPADNPIAPHTDWERSQFVLNHEGLQRVII